MYTYVPLYTKRSGYTPLPTFTLYVIISISLQQIKIGCEYMKTFKDSLRYELHNQNISVNELANMTGIKEQKINLLH